MSDLFDEKYTTFTSLQGELHPRPFHPISIGIESVFCSDNLCSSILRLSSHIGILSSFFSVNIGEDFSIDGKNHAISLLSNVLSELAVLCSYSDLSLDSVAEENIEKLGDRKQRETLRGTGDKR